MQTANYQILRAIEKSPYSQYITVPKSALQNYIYSMKLGLQNAMNTNAINANAINVMTNLCNIYNAAFGDGSANILQLYYALFCNKLQSNALQRNKIQSNELISSLNNYNAISNVINYLRDIIRFLYSGNYINGEVYNFFINVFLQNIITLVGTMNESNFSIGSLSYYINGDYTNCISSGNNPYACNYYMEGYKLLEKKENTSIIPISTKRRNFANSTNEYIMPSTMAANLRMRDPEDQYKLCINTAFMNNSSEADCNQYLYLNLNI
jgi:hypothetical protein